MRYNFSFGLSISFYLFIVLLHNFLDCQDHCEQLLDDKVVHENGSYKYSYNNYYAQRIRLNQSHPVVNGSFTNLFEFETVFSLFKFKYYGIDPDHFIAYSKGEIVIRKNGDFGTISNRIANIVYTELQLLQEWIVANITSLIYPSGKISIYYEKIPVEIEESKRQSKISCKFACVSKICSTYNSQKACENSTRSNVACIWCERINVCIDSNDQDTHDLKINDCRIENINTDVHEETKQNKSSRCLYVAITLVISFFVLFYGCLIWIWFRRRQRYSE
ncbi:unnamed protein product [Schistosoma margrebowiei]|uniref:Egg protein CP391S-like protein n=1 Tax=Schistosoma margrebowiei TaxID=48269 RepID=A0AA85AFH1_9TREM|nr:unnamed protein product [Schistosoma margrebowiei]